MWGRGVRAPHPDVVVAAIDERSVQRYGRWPWSRELLARAVARLHEAGPAAIGLDITFTDEDHGSDAAVMSEAADALGRALGGLPESSRAAFSPVLATLKDRASATGDAALARALADAPEVVQGVSAYGSGEAQDYLEQREVAVVAPPLAHAHPLPRTHGQVVLRGSAGPEHRRALRLRPGSTPGPPPPGAEAGPLQRPPRRRRRGALHSALRPARASAGAAPLPRAADRGHRPRGHHRAGLGPGARSARRREAPSRRPPGPHRAAHAQAAPGPHRLPRSGGGLPHRFPRRRGGRKLPDGALRGKVLLVGVTLVGQYDQVVTPFRNLEAGIYAHAAMLSSVLSGRFLQRGTGAVLAELVFILGAGLLLGLVLPRASPWLKAAVPLALALGWMAVVQLALRRGVVLASALPLANVFVTAFAVVFVGYLSTDREKMKLRPHVPVLRGRERDDRDARAPRAAPPRGREARLHRALQRHPRLHRALRRPWRRRRW